MRPLIAFTVIALAASAATRAIHGPFQSATVSSLLPALQLRELQVNFTNATTVSIAADDPWSLDPDDENDNDEPWSFDPVDEDTPEQAEPTWCKAKSRGVKLIKAMMMNDQDAAATLAWPYVQSPWDGDLKPELRKWGYLDDDKNHAEVDGECDFDKAHEMGDTFKDLQIDPRSKGNGGPNQCFYVEHMNGPTVIHDEDGKLPFEEDQHYQADNKDYRVCEAFRRRASYLLN